TVELSGTRAGGAPEIGERRRRIRGSGHREKTEQCQSSHPCFHVLSPQIAGPLSITGEGSREYARSLRKRMNFKLANRRRAAALWGRGRARADRSQPERRGP